MNSEEIKGHYDMRDIIERYGLKANRAGFIVCPFHQGDKNASMKIYEKDFHCFGCGAHGDIFKFVQMMDGVGFSDAFLSLGGEYVKPTSVREKLLRDEALRNAEKERQAKLKAEHEAELARRAEIKKLGFEIAACRIALENEDVFSEVWSFATDRLLMAATRLYDLMTEGVANNGG